MEVSQTGLAFLLCYAFFCGVALGVVYDCFRITRLCLGSELPPIAKALRGRLTIPECLKIFPKRKREGKSIGKRTLFFIIFAEDVIFCFLAAITLIILLYEKNDGQFRLSALFSMAVGFTIYLFTIGKVVLLISGTITAILRAAFAWIFSIFLYPWVKLSHFLFKFLRPLMNILKAQWKKIKKMPFKEFEKFKRKSTQKKAKQIKHAPKKISNFCVKKETLVFSTGKGDVRSHLHDIDAG